MTIHDEHPFHLPPEERDLGRRFRGRLASGVTVMTAGTAAEPVGLTASSVTLVDGDPWRLVAVISDTSDFYDVVLERGKFLIHCLELEHQALADRLAGLSPSPGGMFRGLGLVDTEWGPRIEGLESWLGAQSSEMTPVGHQHLLIGEVAHVEVHDVVNPLIYFRGRYRALGQR